MLQLVKQMVSWEQGAAQMFPPCKIVPWRELQEGGLFMGYERIEPSDECCR